MIRRRNKARVRAICLITGILAVLFFGAAGLVRAMPTTRA